MSGIYIYFSVSLSLEPCGIMHFLAQFSEGWEPNHVITHIEPKLRVHPGLS